MAAPPRDPGIIDVAIHDNIIFDDYNDYIATKLMPISDNYYVVGILNRKVEYIKRGLFWYLIKLVEYTYNCALWPNYWFRKHF